MSVLSSAQTPKDIFNPDVPLVFFGADFSQVQFTKAETFNNKPDILRFFVDCNNLLKSNGYQNLLKKRLRREEIKTDFSYVTKNNESVEWQNVYSDNIDYSISDEGIQNMIRNLNIDQGLYKDHIGIVMCEENYSKTKTLGTVSVVFFSINDLKSILIKRYSLKPSGYGFLNYWGMINLQAINSLKKLYGELK
jgi:hypothetical protein